MRAGPAAPRRVLALETATPFLVLGLLGTGQAGPALETVERVERAHAELALGAVRALFERAGLEPRADLVVVGIGPGSYTGVRVGASLALGLARAWNAPVVGVGTLEAIAARGSGLVAASLDARKGNVYGAVYRVTGGLIGATLAGAQKHSLGSFEALIPPGATWRRDDAPGGLALARLGLERLRRGETGLPELSYL